MTNDEIIIALRAVAKNYEGKFVRTFETNINAMATDAADHIERLCDENNFLKAEIERLQKANERFEKEFDSYYARVKSEARKEFVERLVAIYENDKTYDRPNAHTLVMTLFRNIDNLVKEMRD